MDELTERLVEATTTEDWRTASDAAWEIMLHPDATDQQKMFAKHLRTMSQRIDILESERSQ